MKLKLASKKEFISNILSPISNLNDKTVLKIENDKRIEKIKNRTFLMDNASIHKSNKMTKDIRLKINS